MWGQLALAVLQQLPSILQFAEGLVPGTGKGQEKKLTVTSKMVEYEGALALDQRVKDAKATLIDAQVAYVNAVEAAAKEAQALGIVLPAVVPPILTPVAPMVGTGGTSAGSMPTVSSMIDALTKSGV